MERFSIGTGRPPIIGIQNFEKSGLYSKYFSGFDSRDQLIIAELKLYICTSRLIEKTGSMLQLDSWTVIKDWREEYKYLDGELAIRYF